MSYSGIEHKLRVFISSKCGGKYSVARKALKALLEATGLVEVYCFEAEPASSEDTQSAYLEYVDNSNLCIFLVDNADGVPAAVLSEEKRAKDKALRLLYLFCDADKKEATPMQEEIKASLSQKYFVVHDFSDIVNASYQSVMQDLIAVYKRKESRLIDGDEKDEANSNLVLHPITGTYSVSKKRYPRFTYVSKSLTKRSLFDDPTEEIQPGTELDKLLSAHLLFVLRKAKFEEDNLIKLRDEILKVQDESIKDLITKRFNAQNSYYCSKYEDALESLKEALNLAIVDSRIPGWVANDIAIDIRHVQGRIDEQKNQFTLNGPGQTFLDNSEEPVYYPYLDRQVEKMQEEIAEQYCTQLNISPYTTTIGGNDQLFLNLANAFCIAEMHGSIVQTEITRDRLVSIYSMLCTLYENHSFLFELIRLLVVNLDRKKLDSVIRTYNLAVEILSYNDISSILSDIETIPHHSHRLRSKYLLTSCLGYYMDDEAYEQLTSELSANAMVWAFDKNRILSLSSYILDFFKGNIYRMDIAQTIDFILAVFKNGLARFYMDCFKIIQILNFSRMPTGYQREVRQLLADIIAKRISCSWDPYLEYTIIRFCKGASIPFKRLEKSIEKEYPSFYNDTYKLELFSGDEGERDRFIRKYLAEAQSRNATQGVNGAYSGYAHESYDIIYNIIKNAHDEINIPLLKDVLDSIISTLAAEQQTVSAKTSAIRLMQLLYFRFPTSAFWSQIKEQMISCQQVYAAGYEMDFMDKSTNYILSFAYELFVSSFMASRIDVLAEKLFSIDHDDTYTIIQCLKIIADYLRDTSEKDLPETSLSAFLFFSITMSQHRERDIKYFATICLIELTNFPSTKKMSLIRLSRMMDIGSHNAKIAIISRVGRISAEDDTYVRQIINKGKADSHYLVRHVSEQKSKAI